MKIEFKGTGKNNVSDVSERLEPTLNRKGGTKYEIY
jgi:hypothetical protein